MNDAKREEIDPCLRQSIAITYEGSNLKRIAWAYGCAKQNSPQESILREMLIERVKVAQLPTL